MTEPPNGNSRCFSKVSDPQAPERALNGRIVLVTGASRGLGRAIALEAARQGAQIIAIARNQGGLEELDDETRASGNSLTLLPLDLRQGEQVDRLGPSIFQRFGRLDAFCHCAAELGLLTRVTDIEPKRLEQLFATNLFATQRLLRTLDPLFRASTKPSIVIVTDSIAHASKAYWGPYAATKAALESLIESYRAETRFRGLTTHIIDPGPMATRLRAQAYPGEAADTQIKPERRANQIIPYLAGHATETNTVVRLAD